MNQLEKLYIEVELKVTPFEELGNTASMHVYEKGIKCYTEDLYEIIYEHLDHWDYGDEGFDKDLEKLLNNKDNTLLRPLDCNDEVSYDDFMEWLDEKRHRNLNRCHTHLQQAYANITKHIDETGGSGGTVRQAIDLAIVNIEKAKKGEEYA
tara:strand:- start:807 stop:1259 length:453 start_codon:yes stop_codon:yes gene_type:complete